MLTVVGGNIVYPTLQNVADLFRSGINDTANNTTGTGTGMGNTAGIIMPNTNPDLCTFMDAAIDELYSDLRNIGSPELIQDNYILEGLPALTAADPTIQVCLSPIGFFDGTEWNSQWTLPQTCREVLRVWERQNGTTMGFTPMRQAPNGLPPTVQGFMMGAYELRQGGIWMPGALYATDIRIRMRITYPLPIYSASLDFTTTYIPLAGCTRALAAKMRVQYAQRFAPDQYQLAIAEEARQMSKLRLEVIRQLQSGENMRAEFGDAAVQDFAIASRWL